MMPPLRGSQGDLPPHHPHHQTLLSFLHPRLQPGEIWQRKKKKKTNHQKYLEILSAGISFRVKAERMGHFSLANVIWTVVPRRADSDRLAKPRNSGQFDVT